MDPRIRLAAFGAVVVMIVLRVFIPDFLSATAFPLPFTENGVSWWTVVFWPLVTITALLISPAFVSLVTVTGRRFFIPSIILIALALGVLLIWDGMWNAVVCGLFGDDCIRSHFAQSTMQAVFGGP